MTRKLQIHEALGRIISEIAEVIDNVFNDSEDEQIYEEFADVIVTAVSLAYIFSQDEARVIYSNNREPLISHWMRMVAKKNDRKTNLTHELRDGKIQKKRPAPETQEELDAESQL